MKITICDTCKEEIEKGERMITVGSRDEKGLCFRDENPIKSKATVFYNLSDRHFCTQECFTFYFFKTERVVQKYEVNPLTE